MAAVPPPSPRAPATEAHTLHNLSFKHDLRPRTGRPAEPGKDPAVGDRREALQGELNRTRSELHAAAEERDNMVRAYEDYIEKLQRENRQLLKSGASEKSDIAVSRKLQDIELQNDRIMENLRSTTATLSENEKSYISKINLLFSEKQALEQQISALHQKTHESEIQTSRYEQLKQQFREVNAELENEREKSIELNQTEKKLQRRVDQIEGQMRERARRISALEAELEQLTEENKRVRAELSECQKLRDTELGTLNDRLERLIALISAKDCEIEQLRKEVTRSSGVGRLRPPGEGARRREEEYETARRRNSELARKLVDLSHRYDEMMENMASAAGSRARREHANPFAASEVEAGRYRRQGAHVEYGEAHYTPRKPRDEDASTSMYSAPSPHDRNKASGFADPQPFHLPPGAPPNPHRPFQPLMGSDGKKDQVSRVLINGKVVYSATSNDASINDPAAIQQYVNALANQELKKLRTSLRSNDQGGARPRNASNPARLEQSTNRQAFGEAYSNGREPYQMRAEPPPPSAGAGPHPPYHDYFNR